MENKSESKVGLIGLTGLVIGSIIGSGAFSFPGDMAKGASAGAIILAWCITGIGMFTLAYVFQHLSNKRPDLNCGIYSYAKEGFGDYTGFNCAWGHWISSMLGNISYLVMLFCSLGYFFPAFGSGNNLASLIGATIVIWIVHILISKGIRTAAFVNIVTTIGKLMPIVFFVVVSILLFKVNIFKMDFWGHMNTNLGSVMTQVKSTMLITLWAFIGIESAVILSGRAKVQKDIGKATILGLFSVLIIYVLISLLALGTMSQQQLAGLKSPSMAYALEFMVGKWGAAIVIIGLIISLLGVYLDWTLICAEVSYNGGKGKAFPKFFSTENKHGSPKGALLATNLITQFFLICAFFSKSTYQVLYSIASSAVLVPYFFSALYSFKLSRTEDGSARGKDIFISGLGVVYALWLMYAAGLHYMLLLTILFSAGIFVYYKARKEEGQVVFTKNEKIIASILLILGIMTVILAITGVIKII